jgi:hypothetical protein
MFNWFSKKPRTLEERADEFWAWFSKESEWLLNADYREVAEVLPKRLNRVHDGLVFEMDAQKVHPRELTISADGIAAHFSAVETVVDRAPPFPAWSIRRFRSRNPGYARVAIQFGPVKVAASDITCSLVAHGGHVHVDMFIPGCPTPVNKAYMGLGFLMIDGAIGEYDAVVKMGTFTILNPGEPGMGMPRVPFAEFSKLFDDVFERECCGGA